MTPTAPNNLTDKFDFGAIFDPSIQEMEKKFQGELLFKYYSDGRRDFFKAPRIRFTQKTALNDRFELSKRWNEFAGPPVRSQLAEAIKKSLSKRLADENELLARLEDHFAGQGARLSPAQRELILERQKSPEGKALLATQQSVLDPSIDFIFEYLSLNAEKIIDKIVSGLGIFSVSETSTNDQLWALYASDGRGFAVGFNIRHPFLELQKMRLRNGPYFIRSNTLTTKSMIFGKIHFIFLQSRKADGALKKNGECSNQALNAI